MIEIARAVGTIFALLVFVWLIDALISWIEPANWTLSDAIEIAGVITFWSVVLTLVYLWAHRHDRKKSTPNA